MKTLAKGFLLSLMPLALVMGQTPDVIRQEAYPEYVEVVDQSPAAQLWRDVVAAKESGNESLHASLIQQFRQQFPERFSVVAPVASAPVAVARELLPPSGSTNDWGPGDVRIYAGAILTPANLGNGRNVQLEADSLGNKYVALISGSGDTLLVYKSTNEGLSWTRISSILPGTGTWHSFDFFVTDSASVFKLGFAAVRRSAGYAGEIFWLSLNDNGTGFQARPVQTRYTGRGLINPAIVSDGFLRPPATTYWYMVYENVDSASGVCTAAVAGLSADWGQTWMLDSARTSFNDYDLDIELTYNPDSIHVLLTNDLTPTDPNLRLRRIALSGYGSATWAQFNPASTSSPEFGGSLVTNRQTNEMLVTYTITQSGNQNVAYSYRPGGGAWTTGVLLSSLTNNEGRARADCQESQGAYRVSYVSSGASYDTVIYYSTFSLSGGFTGRRVVNEQSGANTLSVPDIIGFRQNASSFGGGVAFAGGTAGAFYDGSNITPNSVRPDGNGQPGAFALGQNYPNPFNPTTSFEFRIPRSTFVEFKVYDVLGREVATLVNEVREPGTYSVQWDARLRPSDSGGQASARASGVYFYRLQAGSFAETKKLILLR